jgi:hypothetical protein
MVVMIDTTRSQPSDAVRALTEELANVLDVAQSLVTHGRSIDLTGLNDRVGLLCAKALDLPPDEGRRVRPCLIALSGSMEALTRALQKAAQCSLPQPPS